MPTTDRIKTPDTFWKALESLSIQRPAVLREANLPIGVAVPEASMTTAQLFDVWDALQTLGGPDIGLKLTRAMNGPTLPPSFLVAYHAKNVGEALSRIARFKSLSAPEDINIRMDEDSCVITTKWTYARRDEPPALTDATFSSLVNMVRAGTGQNIKPKHIEFCRKKSAALQSWFDCNITWDAPNPRLVFDKSDLDIPFTSYNRQLFEMLDAALNENLKKAENGASITDQVRWHMRRSLTGGRPELRNIARDMAVSDRSLQRHLQGEGHSFKSLLSDTRHDLACEYLSEPNRDISEIACLLGYDDQGSFYRAFQKWENRTPAEWRALKQPGTGTVSASK